MYQPQPIITQPGQQQHTSNTIIVQQQQGHVVHTRPWTTGLFDCCSDIPVCLCTTFCYTCMAMKVASDMEEFVCLPCCVPAATLTMRVKMRAQERIPGSICNDCLTECFCGYCSLCQLAREVKTVKAQQSYVMTNSRM
ncbi:placenta-specific gene 8 protein-like [Biomphalaria glabrata]|uniref:Placenta-specific gene 8 protein-like n=1 Tax=Biomphalaria glabrata TaxID=6526 RepID=A0A9W2Z9S1_BIOGL|nr:placenta-specific gene 8 protein-like [Biomphalaria glabrata]XP_055871718.1 placenta-specific gene 8 protein-like [Biomphalaria glabrata]